MVLGKPVGVTGPFVPRDRVNGWANFVILIARKLTM